VDAHVVGSSRHTVRASYNEPIPLSLQRTSMGQASRRAAAAGSYSGGPSTKARGQIVFARVSRYRGAAARLREGFEAVTAELEQIEGFSHAYFLTNREHSRAMSITLWESEAALTASAEHAHKMRTQAAEPADASIESVESYEVVLTANAGTRD
jgi:heme-degrading monooxygenase HmoA